MTVTDRFQLISNGIATPYGRVPLLPFRDFSESVVQAAVFGWRVSSLFAMKTEEGFMEIAAILADDYNGRLLAARAVVEGGSFPSMTPRCPQVHLFEREIHEQTGLVPEGHPWLKPVRFAPTGFGTGPRSGPRGIGLMDFYRIGGDEVHEVAVGPIHAGIIEPGHFRFQCQGETVLHLEISLGYQHRGIEEALRGGPHPGSIHQVEAASGDSTVAHTWAWCQNLEALTGAGVEAREWVLRSVALELERVANHTGDLGALAGDVGFLPTQNYCGRLRGDFLNLTAFLGGNRFGRGFLRPGRDRQGLEDSSAKEFLGRLDAAERDLRGAVELMWNSSSVQERFDGTGPLTRSQAVELGVVGPAARASGVETDVRLNHPFGPYRFMVVPLSVATDGDVQSRAFVRWLEIRRSLRFIRERIRNLPPGGGRVPGGPVHPGSLVASLVEGWRGEVCHVAVTDRGGRFLRYKITDPSFHNWSALALAMRGQALSDFPVCNKSFNLSYCGQDL